MEQTGGDALARQLALEGVTDVFGVPGVQLDWAVDGLRKMQDRIRYLVTRHEQATSYMADGYARSTNGIGVCMVVPGPGLLNAMAGLATAYACNSRVLCICACSFPVLYVGGGVIASSASLELQALAEKLQMPVVMGENGKGAVSDRHPLAFNTLEGRDLFSLADVVLVVGSRFVETAMGKPAWPPDDKTYIFINLDEDVFGAPRRADIAIKADCRLALAALDAACSKRRPSNVDFGKLRASAREQMLGIEPQGAWVRALRAGIPDDGVLVNELTQVGYFARLAYPVYQPRTFLTPVYQGTLGYGFPTALGVAAADPKRMVVSINGDGGFGWGLQELSTARKYDLNVTIVVFNDGHFGNVRKMQQDQFGKEFGVQLCNPRYDRLAAAFEIPYSLAEGPADLERLLVERASNPGPILIEVKVGPMPSPWHLLRLVPPPFAKR
ncbi:thiamine pyrophosphate-binding protein [Bradyrhizobium murdochi]|uniref:thiamine pyrophosphate-binding protein n=1 Tax=Bradyrhizobium murdochi TaxID=1038859 RepID=UPI000417515F|nr:thiamine pyrophosphate-binding protein [Bradyrhizobium murdochi]